ncbi:MAG: hypothetical protein GX265_04105 [Mollicutes bacterium]|nr:hypothetical protein [Mollicutes bacterium]
MKLNNKGWGFGTMIFFITILCLFLIIAIYYIFRLYNNIEVKKQTSITEVRTI